MKFTLECRLPGFFGSAMKIDLLRSCRILSVSYISLAIIVSFTMPKLVLNNNISILCLCMLFASPVKFGRSGRISK